MAGKNDNKTQQVYEESEPVSVGQNSTHCTEETSPDKSQAIDLEKKRPSLSRASTLESIKEEDTTSLDEKLLLESFKSITDIFENGYPDDESSNDKSSELASAISRTPTSFSEDGDSLDEEVRQIMLKSEEEQKQTQNIEPKQSSLNNMDNTEEVKEKTQINTRKEDVEEYEEYEEEVEEEEVEVEEDSDDDDEESDLDSVATDTESMSNSEPDSEVASLSEDERTGHWTPGVDGSSEDEEFDLEAHINKLCSETVDTDSSTDSDESESDTEKVIRKVMRKYSKKYDDDSDSEDDASDEEPELEELEDEKDPEADTFEEVEIKDDDESSVFSSSDGTDSDFLDDDSASISTASSDNEECNMNGHDKETSQTIGEEVPYLSDSAKPSHELVYKYYLGSQPENSPEKIEVQDGEIGRNIGLDNTLASRSVINLRWPFTSYYVKEFDLDSEVPTFEDEGLLPSYKSMKSSASFPGRRRDVMLGRVWWVEWWAKDSVKDEEQKNNTGEREENLKDVEEVEQLEREEYNTHM